MTDRTGDHKGDRKGRPYRRVPPMTPRVRVCKPGFRTLKIE